MTRKEVSKIFIQPFEQDTILTRPPPFPPPEAGEESGVSYVLIVDEAQQNQKPELTLDTEVLRVQKKPSIYHIGDGNNILIEEEEEVEESDLITEEVHIIASDSHTVQQPKVDDQRRRYTTQKKASGGGGEEQEWACSYCSYVSTKKHLLQRHIKCHSDDRPHKCNVCERGFKTVASLNNHVNTHTGTKPHSCKHCESTFTTSGELVRHVRYKHTLEKPHKCPDCDYASVELSKLRRHIRCHTGERPFQCPHCTYASPDTFKLKRHLRIHTGEKPYQCDTCQARFTQSNSLKAHRLIHNLGDKPVFQCEYCPTTCGRKTDLRIHVQKLHTSETPFPCKKCSESFPDRYSFKLHMKTHEGEKCYKCDYCEYKAMNARHLESHILVHTEEKPFACPQEGCTQSFRQKQLLKRHMNLNHVDGYEVPMPKEKTHHCPTCEKGFHHKGNLIRHMAIHDPSSAVQEEAESLKRGRRVKIEPGASGSYADTFDFSEGPEEGTEEEEEEEEQEELEESIEYAEDELVENDDLDESRFVVLEVINNDQEIELDV